MRKIIILLMCIPVFAFSQTKDSLDIKIGQMILIGMPKAEVDTLVLEEVRKGKAGSLIYFEKNIPKNNPYTGLKKMSWTYQSVAPIPLLIGIDQEGGKVNRLKEKYGFPRSITNAAMGKVGTLDSVRFYGESTAATLAGLGININFAPVVDLGTNPDNPIIAKVERAFSANADSVALLAKEFIKQHRKMGVLTALKHFPGHGSSKDDTHKGLADVTNTWEEKELIPYKALLDSNYVDAVMTSHIVNSNLDKDGTPGTLSKDIIDGILRKKLGFQGVVFSDDMQMHAITKYYGLEDAVKKAINAGVDILCVSNNISGSEERTVDKIHTIIRTAVSNGEIPKSRIDESFKRVMRLKSRLNSNTPALTRELLQKEKQIATLEKLLAEEKSKSVEKEPKKKRSKKKKKDTK